MPENSEYISKEGDANMRMLLLRDFMSNARKDDVGEYLSLSITRVDNYVCVRITLTEMQPLSYTAIIPDSGPIDLDNVKFVRQSRGLAL
ncbi:hypothetical protein [Methylomonas sp. MgM2]